MPLSQIPVKSVVLILYTSQVTIFKNKCSCKMRKKESGNLSGMKEFELVYFKVERGYV